MMLAFLIITAFLANIPFGWFRSRTRKFSAAWIFFVHATIPFIILLRISLGIGWWAVPFVVAAAVCGQVLGGRLQALRSAQCAASAEAEG